jgi:hypothetical protein
MATQSKTLIIAVQIDEDCDNAHFIEALTNVVHGTQMDGHDETEVLLNFVQDVTFIGQYEVPDKE